MKRHRYRVVSTEGPLIAKLQVGSILVDKKGPEGKDERFPLGYRTWTFENFRLREMQHVTAEYLGPAVYDVVTRKRIAPIEVTR